MPISLIGKDELPLPASTDAGKYLKVGTNLTPTWTAETPGGTVTADGAFAANAIGAATGATTALKLANLTENASETQEGVVEVATAPEIVTGSDTARVPSVANLKTALASDGMWLTKRTKMPDGATAVFSVDGFSSTSGYNGEGNTTSIANNNLRVTWAEGSLPLRLAKGGSYGGKTVAARVRGSRSGMLLKGYNGTWSPWYGLFPVSTDYQIIVFTLPLGSSFWGLGQDAANCVSGDYIEVNAVWIGDYSYLTGSLSEEAARIANQLGGSAGVGNPARGEVSIPVNANAGDNVVLGGKTYTFRTALTPTDGEVLIGADGTESWTNLWKAVARYLPETNDGVIYKIATANSLMTIDSVGRYFAYNTPGEQGNQITMSTNAPSRIILSGSTLTGGISDAAAKARALVAPIIAGGGTRPAAAQIELSDTTKIGYETTVDVASGGTFTLPSGGTWIYNVYGYGATISSAKRGSAAGGSTLTVAGANASVGYRRYA